MMSSNMGTNNFGINPNFNLNIGGVGNRPSGRKLHSPRKVIFSEPYEIVPNYYIDNDFKKGKGDCVPKPNPNQNPTPSMNMPFLPFFSSLLGGGLGNIGSMLNGLLNGSSSGSTSPITNILSNPEMLTSISKFLFKEKTSEKKKHSNNSQEINIDEYTRVE